MDKMQLEGRPIMLQICRQFQRLNMSALGQLEQTILPMANFRSSTIILKNKNKQTNKQTKRRQIKKKQNQQQNSKSKYGNVREAFNS